LADTALLDNILADSVWYNFTDTEGWNYQVNGVYKDYFSETTGISNYAGLAEGDVVTYYYVRKATPPPTAEP